MKFNTYNKIYNNLIKKNLLERLNIFNLLKQIKFLINNYLKQKNNNLILILEKIMKLKKKVYYN